MVKELLGTDDLVNAEFTPAALEEQLIAYLEDNLIETSGIHAQLGLRFKVLVADAHLNLRYNIAEDVKDASDSFLSFSCPSHIFGTEHRNCSI